MEPVHRSIDPDAPLTYRGARQLLGLVILLVIVAFILRALESVLLLFAIVFLVAMVLNPIVVWLQRKRIPRGVAVALVVLALLVVLTTVVLFAIPPLAQQVNSLIQNAPHVWDAIRARMDAMGEKYPAVRDALPQTDQMVSQIAAAAGTVGNILLRSTIGFVGGVFSAALAILLLIFVLASPGPIVAAYLSIVPARFRGEAKRTLERLMHQMVMWARGVAINGAITGVSIGTLLWLVGIQPALMFGAFAFLGEFLPNIGAFFVSIPILFVALSLGATKFWLALGVILLVYQVELNVLVPFVLGHEMRLHPVNILFFTIAMATSFGILGEILAVPAAALVQIVIDEFYIKPRKLDQVAIDREAAALVKHER
jgi:predicted PurR-regulated permease PerM